MIADIISIHTPHNDGESPIVSTLGDKVPQDQIGSGKVLTTSELSHSLSESDFRNNILVGKTSSPKNDINHCSSQIRELFMTYDEIKKHSMDTNHNAGLEVDSEYKHPCQLADKRRKTWPYATQLATAYPQTALIYETVKATGLPNAMSSRLPLPSGLHVEAWEAIATGHRDDAMVLDGIKYGFSLQYWGNPIPSEGREYNHSSATQHMSHVNDYLYTEIQAGAMLGPMDASPFTWQHLSPLMTRPKSGGNARRVIVDLSYPDNDNVNSKISKNMVYGTYFIHNLPTIDDLVSMAHPWDHSTYAFSVDIARAYRNFRSDPLDWPLLCLLVNGNTYLDIAMPFGARMSSLYMQQIAKFITRHLEAKGIDALIYLDDIVGISAPFDKAIADFNYTVDLLAYLGLPLAVGKAVPPTRDIVWLGIRFSIQEKFLQIPPQKLQEIVTDIDTLSKRSRMNRRDVQRLAGRINHIAKVCRPARLFMSRILMYLRGHPPGYTKVSEGTKADLRWLNRFLPEYNGVSILPKEQPIRSIEADSCMIGGGAASGDKCYMYKYIPPLLGEMHISQLEAVNCVAAIRAFISSADRGNTVEVKCDNMAAVSTYTSGRGRDEILLACARAIWWHMAATDTTIVFTHTPGILMGTADTLSRAFLSDTYHARAQAMIAKRGFTVVHLRDEMFDVFDFL